MSQQKRSTKDERYKAAQANLEAMQQGTGRYSSTNQQVPPTPQPVWVRGVYVGCLMWPLMAAYLFLFLGIVLGAVELAIQVDPDIVVAAQNPQTTCNGVVMQDGDLCQLFDSRTGQAIGEPYTNAPSPFQKLWAGLTSTLAQPGVNIFMYIYMGISLVAIWLWFHFRKRLSQLLS